MHRKVTFEIGERYNSSLSNNTSVDKSDIEEWIKRIESSDTIGQLVWNMVSPIFGPSNENMGAIQICRLGDEDKRFITNYRDNFINALKDEIHYM